MSVESWNGSNGSFRSARNWTPARSPKPGDTLYAQSGSMTLNRGTFGSSSVKQRSALLVMAWPARPC